MPSLTYSGHQQIQTNDFVSWVITTALFRLSSRDLKIRINSLGPFASGNVKPRDLQWSVRKFPNWVCGLMFTTSWFQALNPYSVLHPHPVQPYSVLQLPSPYGFSSWDWRLSSFPSPNMSCLQSPQFLSPSNERFLSRSNERTKGAQRWRSSHDAPMDPHLLVSLVCALPKLAQDKGAGHTIYAFD